MNDDLVHELANLRAGAEMPLSPQSEHYIEAQRSLVERTPRILKEGDAFAVLDQHGDLGTSKGSPEGFFFHDMRFLSHYELRFEGRRPLLLSSIVQDDNATLSVDLTNPDIELNAERRFARDVIFIERALFLWDRAAYERIGLRNFDTVTRRFRIDLVFGADFHDLFEIRGNHRRRRGRCSAHVLSAGEAAFHYTGLDHVPRSTRLVFDPPPARLEAGRATFDVTLAPGARTSLFATVLFEEGEPPRPEPFERAYRNKRRAVRNLTRGVPRISSSNELFNEVVRQSRADLYTLVTMMPHGPYPYAGIPWYSTVFGRDAIITALMMLWLDPTIARGVLRHLAATQATHTDDAADAQPGKILHEQRHSEMALLGEVPFRFYFGTVDATPLFVMLAGAYHARTGDDETLHAIWPNVRAALAWMDRYGDLDGDGFIEYARQNDNGLVNQGWKDSYDSIFHADGAAAIGPIALCEVQGYAYAAKLAAAKLSVRFGDEALANNLRASAQALRQRFDEAFWSDEIGTYALALDGLKRPCLVRTSNAGHALFAGIALPERAAGVAAGLLDRDGFSGWGIRTLARGEPRYNPMSYHNGSVWPHDNALIAMGLARYGLRRQAAQVFSGMFQAACTQDLRRLPELFCGFNRRARRGPTSYPVACSPQAWSAAAPFAMIAASFGLELLHDANEVRFVDPVLPDFVDDVVLRGIRIGSSRIDLRCGRHDDDVMVHVLSRDGDARVVVG